MKVLAVVMAVMLLAGCDLNRNSKIEKAPPAERIQAVRCGDELVYEGGTIPEQFWAICSRVIDNTIPKGK